jgi:hypothetical protein
LESKGKFGKKAGMEGMEKNGTRGEEAYSAPGAASYTPRQVPNRDYMREPSFKKNPTARREAVGKSKHTMRKLGTR